MSDLHEAYEAIVGPDVPLALVGRRAALRGLEAQAAESAARVFNLVVAAERGWVPGGIQ